MTIIISSQEVDGSLVMECFNCFEKESSNKVGMFITWKKFDVQTQNNTGGLKVICLNCGHSFPRNILGFAKHKGLETIHLCHITDGHSFSARCGMMSRTLFSQPEIEEIKKIPKNSKMCKKCAREEGVVNNKWYSEIDKETELEFYRHL